MQKEKIKQKGREVMEGKKTSEAKDNLLKKREVSVLIETKSVLQSQYFLLSSKEKYMYMMFLYGNPETTCKN